MKKLFPFFGVALFLVVGCTYPTSQVTTIDDRPGLVIKNAPSKSVLIVDGINVGAADQFDGNPNFLVLRPGNHKIEVRQGEDTIQSMNVFLGEGTKKEITISSD